MSKDNFTFGSFWWILPTTMNWRIGGVCCFSACDRHETVHCAFSIGFNKKKPTHLYSHTHTHFARAMCCKILIYDYDFMVNLLTLFLFDILTSQCVHFRCRFSFAENLKFTFVSGSVFLNEQFRQKWQWMIHLMWILYVVRYTVGIFCVAVGHIV